MVAKSIHAPRRIYKQPAHPSDRQQHRTDDNGRIPLFAIEKALSSSDPTWLPRVDAFLGQQSWEATWAFMRNEIDAAIAARGAAGGRAAQAHSSAV